MISVSSTPLTKTVHEWVWSSGVPGGLGFVVGSKSLAFVPYTKGRNIWMPLHRFPLFGGAMMVMILVRESRGMKVVLWLIVRNSLPRGYQELHANAEWSMLL